MIVESNKQNFDPEKIHSNNLIGKLSIFTETLSQKIEITRDLLRASSILSTSMAILSYEEFSKNDQITGLMFAGVSCTSAFALILGLTILSKQQKFN